MYGSVIQIKNILAAVSNSPTVALNLITELALLFV